ncbi:MAG: amidohydrolase, partial [Longimicrobiales bacterium]
LPPSSRTLLVVADRVRAGVPQSHSPGEAEAVWIRDGRVVAVGRARDLRSAAADAPVLALPGTTITPGFADSHIHLTEWAFARREADLSAARDPAHAAALLAAHPHPPEGWIRGRGWNPHGWDGIAPTRRILDSHFPDRPVALQSHDMHAIWANGEALRRAGIDAAMPDPAGGRIVRDEHGEATGLLLENAATLIVGRIPAPSFDEALAAVRDAQSELHALGITAVHSFPGIHTPEPDPLPILEALRARDELRLRVLHHIALDTLDAAIRIGLRSGFGGEWIRIGGVKLFLDGALGSRTAWMRAPYEGEAQCGIRTFDPRDFLDTVTRAAAAGIASTVHAIGDAAVALALDVLGRPALRVPALPHRIEHVQCCPPDLLELIHDADVTCSVQPAHLITDWRAADRYWGDRARWT